MVRQVQQTVLRHWAEGLVHNLYILQIVRHPVRHLTLLRLEGQNQRVPLVRQSHFPPNMVGGHAPPVQYQQEHPAGADFPRNLAREVPARRHIPLGVPAGDAPGCQQVHNPADQLLLALHMVADEHVRHGTPPLRRLRPFGDSIPRPSPDCYRVSQKIRICAVENVVWTHSPCRLSADGDRLSAPPQRGIGVKLGALPLPPIGGTPL